MYIHYVFLCMYIFLFLHASDFFLSHQARGQCSLPPPKKLYHTTPNLAAAVYQSAHPAVKSEEASFGSLFDFGISLFVASLGGIGCGLECGGGTLGVLSSVFG
jgi:hypothetical protein